MAEGDFSALLPKTVIKDPTTGLPFPNNKIPLTSINPIGQALAKFYPTPTSATAPGLFPAHNYNFNQPQVDSLNLGSLRFDHMFSAKDTINASYNDFEDSQLTQDNTVCGSRAVPGFD